MTEEQFVVEIIDKDADFNYPSLPESKISTNIMKIAPISAYLVYDEIKGDLHAGLVYDRLMRNISEDNDMIIHAKEFLHAYALDQAARIQKPYISGNVHFAPTPGESRTWAQSTFQRYVPSVHSRVVDPIHIQMAGISSNIQ